MTAKPPIPSRNPFAPNPKTIEVNLLAPGQRDAIMASFSSETRKQHGRAVEAFIQCIAWVELTVFSESTASEKAASESLEETQRAASALLQALNRLSQCGGVMHLAASTGSNTTPPLESLKDQMSQRASESNVAYIGVEVLLRRVWEDVNALRIQAYYARRGLKPSRGDRSKDRQAFILVELLHQEWCLIFGAEPNVARNSEFHNVAVTVGEALNIYIGRSALANKRFRSHLAGLMPY